MVKKVQAPVHPARSRIYVGCDESGHGTGAEYFTAVFSSNPEDAYQSIFPRFAKKSYRRLDFYKDMLEQQRDFSWLVAAKEHYARIPEEEFIGRVLASLCRRSLPKDLARLTILLDGARIPLQLCYARSIVSDAVGLPARDIDVFAHVDFDRRNHLVSLADAVAHHLFKAAPVCSREELRQRKRRLRILTRPPQISQYSCMTAIS